ncbi:coiled-coil domain-containing protein 106-like [Triplophysa rosa]|uniref:Coiled-coil domain-containing protein 106-like n=1 Tax=Triplophysa rosa TaxID=992332 RepID=A0A9W7T3K7_TRIRA|nr:coiled-coil domain-containing protein 106-like [Triplophysa rosa]KAI7789914.1 putative coiled-coil domain-containing protein 106-like [Triplophysa rosa]
MASKRVQRRRKTIMDQGTAESPNVTQDRQAPTDVEETVEEGQRREDKDEVSSEESVQCDERVMLSDKTSSLKLQQKNKRLQKKIKKMHEEIYILKKKLKARTGKSKKYRSREDDSDDSSSSSTSSSTSRSTSISSLSTLSSSSSSKMGNPKTKKKRKEKHYHPLAMARARTTDDVVRRYHKVLKAYKNQGSMTKAFKTVGVDRNTLALSAPLAEISIACPKFLKSLPPFNIKKDKLLEYSKRCAESMTPEVTTKIEDLKAKGKLLPIKYKYR